MTFLSRKRSVSPCGTTIRNFHCSFLGHKEFRFLFGILPLAMHICGVFLHSVCDDDPEDTGENSGENIRHIPRSVQACSFIHDLRENID